MAEFPILEGSHGQFHEVTDLDMLAFRFPGAGHLAGARMATEASFEVDHELHVPSGQADMIIGEVKEGAPKLNAAARKPAVLAAALSRFGCCSLSEAPETVDNLAREGRASLPHGHSARMVVSLRPLTIWTRRRIASSRSATLCAFSKITCANTGTSSVTRSSRTRH